MVTVRAHRGVHHARNVFGTVIVLVCLILIGCVFLLTAKPEQKKRSLIIHTNPLTIVTWNTGPTPRYTVLIFPSVMQVEATHGMGWYTIDALWKLDTMDHRHGELFTSSMADACGFPMKWYIEPTVSVHVGDTQDQIFQSILSSVSLPTLVSASVQKTTNMTVVDAVRVWRRLQSLAPDTVTIVDFRQVEVAGDTIMPDGSVVSRFDPMRYDARIGDALEDTQIRQDSLRIALYNTTQTPGIAQELARTIDHIGGFVVSVSNDTPQLPGMCELRGTAAVLHTETAGMLVETYGCHRVETGETQRADIEVRLGAGIVKRYLPF